MTEEAANGHRWRLAVHAALLLIAPLLAACMTWVRWEGPRKAKPLCNAERAIAMLDTTPQPGLRWLDRKLAILSTPFKRRGISGWRETYCVARAAGRLVRDPQYSTDGFWTCDITVTRIQIDSAVHTPVRRFIRLEIEPHTWAHGAVSRMRPRSTDSIEVGGVLVIDTDRNFLEIHPDSDLIIYSHRNN
jgi:hypothetical protein